MHQRRCRVISGLGNPDTSEDLVCEVQSNEATSSIGFLDRVARFGILSRDLGNIQGCWDFSRDF